MSAEHCHFVLNLGLIFPNFLLCLTFLSKEVNQKHYSHNVTDRDEYMT